MRSGKFLGSTLIYSTFHYAGSTVVLSIFGSTSLAAIINPSFPTNPLSTLFHSFQHVATCHLKIVYNHSLFRRYHKLVELSNKILYGSVYFIIALDLFAFLPIIASARIPYLGSALHQLFLMRNWIVPTLCRTSNAQYYYYYNYHCQYVFIWMHCEFCHLLGFLAI